MTVFSLLINNERFQRLANPTLIYRGLRQQPAYATKALSPYLADGALLLSLLVTSARAKFREAKNYSLLINKNKMAVCIEDSSIFTRKPSRPSA